MRSTRSFRAERWFHRCGSAVLLVSLFACAEDTPVSPGPTIVPNRPVTPAPHPATPGAPGEAKLELSRVDVVFNAMIGAAFQDTASISVSGPPSEVLSDLRAVIRYSGSHQDWLEVALNQEGQSATLSVRVASVPLSAGEYAASVQLLAPGAAPESLSVIARVAAGKGIGLNAAEICFTPTFAGPDARPDDVRITSLDGSPIEGLAATVIYDPGQPTGWLSTNLTASEAPARLWLTSSKGAMTPGRYHATVQVSSTTPGIASVPVRVTLTIGPNQPSSTVLAHIAWESPVNGGLAIVEGQHGLRCPDNCSATVEGGVGDYEFTAVYAEYGAGFVRWEGACSGSDRCIVTFDTPGTTKEVTAVFRTRPSYVNFLLRGDGASGSVTVSPAITGSNGMAFSCALLVGVAQPGCSGTLPGGAGTITLTAIPAPGNVFKGWEVTAFDPYADTRSTCADPLSTTCVVTFTHGNSMIDGYVNFSPQ